MDSDLQKFIDAVNTGLSVVKRIAELPGVSVIPYAATLSRAIAAVQTAVEAGQNIAPYIAAITDTFSNPDVSEDDLAALNAKIATLRAELHAPLPQKEAGEED